MLTIAPDEIHYSREDRTDDVAERREL